MALEICLRMGGGKSRIPGPQGLNSQVQQSLGLDLAICIFNACLRKDLVHTSTLQMLDIKQPESGEAKVVIQRGASGTSRSTQARIASCSSQSARDGALLKALPPGARAQPKALRTTKCPPVSIQDGSRMPAGAALAT